MCAALGALQLAAAEQPEPAALSAVAEGAPLPLQFETKISLGVVNGRLDHLSFDAKRQRLLLAERVGTTGSVVVIDLKAAKVVGRIKGVGEPRGVAYYPATDTIFVATGGEGMLRLFRGEDLKPAGKIQIGANADHIRVDLEARQLYVGYGTGAIAVVDPLTKKKLADIPFKGHPEAFLLDAGTPRIFVNVPETSEVVVLDRTARKQDTSWRRKGSRSNFAMALDRASARLLVPFRNPAELVEFDLRKGSTVATARTCGDADDVFFDERRRRVYVSCGEGVVEVFDAKEKSLERISRMPTFPGARTSLFVPELDRLFVAIRASVKQKPEVWVFRPQPG